VKGADGIVGFGRDYSILTAQGEGDDSYSFMKYLKDQGMISKNIFSSKYNDDLKGGKLYLGDYHSDFDSNYTNQCNVVTGSSSTTAPYWSCDLKGAVWGDLTNKTSDTTYVSLGSTAMIDSGTSSMYGPYDDMELFKDYFKDHSSCRSSGYQYICDLPVQPSLYKDLSFVIDGTAYTIPGERMFFPVPERNQLLFYLQFSPDYTFYLLGEPFMQGFHIAFSAEDDVMKFYSPNGVGMTPYGMKTWLIIVIVISSLAFAILAIIGIWCCCRKKRNQEVNTGYNQFLNNNQRYQNINNY